MKLIKLAALAAVTVGVMATSAMAQEWKWRMATIDRETGLYWIQIAQPFADMVEKLTEGRMVIQPLPAGSVGNIFKLYDQVSDGLVEMAQVPPIFLGTKDPTNAMIASFPTGLGVDSFLSWMYVAGGRELWIAHRHEMMNMHPLITGAGPSEVFAHSHIPIRTIADLADKKYRTLGNWAAVVQTQFGAKPTTVPGSEVYGMLEKKGIDLAEYSMPSENLARGYHEVAKYIIYPGIHAPAWAFETVMTLDNWNSLPPDIQEKLELAAKIITFESQLRIINDDMKAMIEFQKGKNELIELSDEFRAKAEEGARAWAREAAEKSKAEGNEWPEKVATSIFEFQDFWRANSKYLVVDHRDR